MSFFEETGWEALENATKPGDIYFRKDVNLSPVIVVYDDGWIVKGLLFDKYGNHTRPISIGVFNMADNACAWADANMHLLEDNGRGGAR